MSDLFILTLFAVVSPIILYALVRLATAAYFKSKQHYESEKHHD